MPSKDHVNRFAVALPFGPGNPHPLSTLKTELVWEGKYDETATAEKRHDPMPSDAKVRTETR